MLPFDPRTEAENRDRWPLAVAKVWDYRGVHGPLPPRTDRPGLHPEHVLDFLDGLRLTVSTEDYGGSIGRVLHVSASPTDGTLRREMQRGALKPCCFCTEVVERVKKLFDREITLAYFSLPAHVPHFYDPPLPV